MGNMSREAKNQRKKASVIGPIWPTTLRAITKFPAQMITARRANPIPLISPDTELVEFMTGSICANICTAGKVNAKITLDPFHGGIEIAELKMGK